MGRRPESRIDALSRDYVDWQVGLSARLPVFEGGLKSSRVGKAHAQVGQLWAQAGTSIEPHAFAKEA